VREKRRGVSGERVGVSEGSLRLRTETLHVPEGSLRVREKRRDERGFPPGEEGKARGAEGKAPG